MRRRNGLMASLLMGTPHLKTGSPVALSSWLCHKPLPLLRERIYLMAQMRTLDLSLYGREDHEQTSRDEIGARPSSQSAGKREVLAELLT
jgi:hypothetical protein